MKVNQVTLSESKSHASTVVVIDVCRAFTTAAFMFAAGAEEIWLVRLKEDAFHLKENNKDFVLVGEENGLPIKGFDYWNSPEQIAKCDFHQKTIVMRTSSGTQGAVLYSGAQLLLAGSFVVADATARHILRNNGSDLTLVTTGVRSGAAGVEDIALADYLRLFVLGKKPDIKPFLEASRKWNPHRISDDPAVLEHLNKDLERCLQPNLFDFSMVINKVEGQVVMTCERPSQA